MSVLAPKMIDEYYREIEYNREVCAEANKATEDQLTGITLIDLL